MIGSRIGSVVIVLALAACGASGGSDFEGTWLEQGPAGQEAEWVFGADGTLSWNVIDQEAEGYDDLRYEVVSSGDPHQVDIRGFDQGPMAGQVLYCIAVFPSDETMRLDCEPGPEDSEASRPTTFSSGALDLTRRTGNGASADTAAPE